MIVVLNIIICYSIAAEKTENVVGTVYYERSILQQVHQVQFSSKHLCIHELPFVSFCLLGEGLYVKFELHFMRAGESLKVPKRC